MLTPSPGPLASSDRLESWKEIADYLGRGVSTVRRWEREEGLPVHRQEHLKRGSVVAFKTEIDHWRQTRTTQFADDQDAPEAPPAAPIRSRWGMAVGAACLAGILAWTMATSRGTSPQRLAAEPLLHIGGPAFEGPPDLSPDGGLAAYSSRAPGISGIYVKPVGSGDARRVTEAPESDEFPRWSPDGQQIVFVRWEGAWRDLMVVPAAGGEPRRVLRRPRGSSYRTQWASWMADGRSLLIADSATAGEPLALYRFDLAASEQTKLTHPPAGSFGDTAQAQSPGGAWVAFVRWHLADRSDLYLLRLATGEETRLTFDGSLIRGVAWEPAGRWLVFSSHRLGAADRLWRIDAASGAVPELISGVDRDALWPSIRAGGGELRLAFQSTRETVNIRYLELGPGPPEPRLVAPSSFVDSASQFSPDGSRIAFASSREGSREIWVCGADGSAPRRLTSFGGDSTDSPRWSPDGTRIALSAVVDHNRDVYVTSAQGGSLQRLTQESSDEGRPSWSRDGKWIWFRSNRSGRAQMWRMPADGRTPARQMTPDGAMEGFESPDGRWFYFAKDRGNLGLWRIPAGGGPEERVSGHVREGWWAMTGAGVFFVRQGPEFAIWHQPLGISEAKLVTPVIPQAGGVWTGFSARFDGKTFLYSQTVGGAADVVVSRLAALE